MATLPLISIITPVYNVSRYLRQCLDSITAQTFSGWELILIDDGSTDSSGVICDEYAQKDIRISVIHKPNTGQADSRNIGIAHARAGLIGFVDSDDWIEKTMFQRLYDCIKETGADIAICGFFLESPGKSIPICQRQSTGIHSDDRHYKTNGHGIGLLSRDEAMRILMEDKIMYGYLWDKLFRRELLTAKMPCGHYYEDHATTNKWMANARTIAITGSPEYHYRLRASSTDHNCSPQKKVDFILAEKSRYDFLVIQHMLTDCQDKYKDRFIEVGLSEAIKISRSDAPWKDASAAVHQIRNILEEYIPVHKKLKLRNRLRLFKLMKSPTWFFITLRLSGKFRRNSYKQTLYP